MASNNDGGADTQRRRAGRDARHMMDDRALSARIGAAYDIQPYEPPAKPWLAPSALEKVAQPFGACHLASALDLGCGSGTLLSLALSEGCEPVVGYDLSADAVRRASERIGNQGSAIQAELLDLAPGDVGTFDLIYCIGVYYVTPREVRAQIVRLIGKCLAPGGIAVVSYYAGVSGAVRAMVARILRSRLGGEGEPAKLLPEARRLLRTMHSHAPPAIDPILLQPDVDFYHEVFSAFDSPTLTSELDALLNGYGIGFATYLAPIFSGGSSAERAVAADAFDLNGGGYRYAMFVKRTG
jgi:SAM-dependent methyltransferase